MQKHQFCSILEIIRSYEEEKRYSTKQQQGQQKHEMPQKKINILYIRHHQPLLWNMNKFKRTM